MQFCMQGCSKPRLAISACNCSALPYDASYNTMRPHSSFHAGAQGGQRVYVCRSCKAVPAKCANATVSQLQAEATGLFAAC
jgi:hypothetical protein